jgi:hypothetical protein
MIPMRFWRKKVVRDGAAQTWPNRNRDLKK